MHAAVFATFLMIAGVSMGMLVFWAWMIVDCARREWPEKTTWLAILVLSFFAQIHWFVAILYYFTVKRKNIGAVKV